MPLQHTPRVERRAAETIARELYTLEAAATPLSGERDQNFLIETSAGQRFVLKIANAADTHPLLEAQNAAMEHVAALRLCPRACPSRNGRLVERVPEGHFVRLLTWVPGVPFGAVPRHSESLLEDLGRGVGAIDAALASFDHPAIHRELHWDLAAGFRVVSEHSRRIADLDLRSLVERVTEAVAARDGARIDRLGRSAIHGDANDYNVLVADAPDGDRISGIIDFGDLVHSYSIADLAIAIAYAILDKSDPLAAAAPIVRGYRRARPIGEDESAALFGLVKLRLCVSACLAAYQQPARPSDEYLAVSQGPIRRTLPRLATIDPARAESELSA